MEYKINNAEFALLVLISEQDGCNGYSLRKIVLERGYDAWSGLSVSSIYVTLKKLEKRGFVTSDIDTNKRTRGPAGWIFRISNEGQIALKRAMKETLSTAREHDPRYNVALSGVDLLDRKTVRECFAERGNALSRQLEKLEALYRSEDRPLAAELLFSRIIAGLEAEITWMKTAQKKLE